MIERVTVSCGRGWGSLADPHLLTAPDTVLDAVQTGVRGSPGWDGEDRGAARVPHDPSHLLADGERARVRAVAGLDAPRRAGAEDPRPGHRERPSRSRQGRVVVLDHHHVDQPTGVPAVPVDAPDAVSRIEHVGARDVGRDPLAAYLLPVERLDPRPLAAQPGDHRRRHQPHGRTRGARWILTRPLGPHWATATG